MKFSRGLTMQPSFDREVHQSLEKEVYQQVDKCIQAMIPAFIEMTDAAKKFAQWLDAFLVPSQKLRHNFEKTLTASERLRYHAILLSDSIGWLDAAEIIEREERYYAQE